LGPRTGWRFGTVAVMRCPYCRQVDDKVVDSRVADDGAAIRRRRECLGCGRRFTTYERLEEVPLLVAKRSGIREPFDRAKIVAGIGRAAKNRPVDDTTIDTIVAELEEELRKRSTGEVTSEQVGLAVLERLRAIDPVTSVRFASVYKGFEDVSDFEREVGILQKTTAPKPPPAGS
jgi:transcriptional repressor NrdR